MLLSLFLSLYEQYMAIRFISALDYVIAVKYIVLIHSKLRMCDLNRFCVLLFSMFQLMQHSYRVYSSFQIICCQTTSSAKSSGV